MHFLCFFYFFSQSHDSVHSRATIHFPCVSDTGFSGPGWPVLLLLASAEKWTDLGNISFFLCLYLAKLGYY